MDRGKLRLLPVSEASMADTGESKKHPASEMQRRRAKEAGNFPRSAELAPALLWLGGIGVLQWKVPQAVEFLAQSLRETLARSHPMNARASLQDLTEHLWSLAWVLLPVLLVVLFAACVAGFSQAGFRWMPQKLLEKFSDEGLRAPSLVMVSTESIVGTILGCLKLFAVLGITGSAFWRGKEEVLSWSGIELSLAAGFAWRFFLGIGWQLGVAWLCFAVLDYAWHWWRFEQQLRMSDTELRDELKETQGNPQVRSQRRRFYADRL